MIMFDIGAVDAVRLIATHNYDVDTVIGCELWHFDERLLHESKVILKMKLGLYFLPSGGINTQMNRAWLLFFKSAVSVNFNELIAITKIFISPYCGKIIVGRHR